MSAVVALAHNDLLLACQIWEDILVDHPKDMFALHSLFFTHITTGRKRGLRDSVYRVAGEYKQGDRYYG